MGYGICYTQSGNVKKYESKQLGSVPTYVTGYTVGYPSTAYYPDMFYFRPNFSCFAYPGPPSFPMYPGFTEGTAEYLYHVSFVWIDSNTHTGTKIYNLMSYTPPDGYVLDENGNYTYIAKATVYSYNVDIKYGNAINTINDTNTIYKEFKYKKADKPIQTTDIRYPVTISISGYTVHCSCERVTGIPGTDNGNFTLKVGITSAYKWRVNTVHFEWVMRDGINQSKSVRFNNIYSSGFESRNSWQVTNSDGNITNYRFVLQIK